nr:MULTISPECIES: PTS sugar transporter subunit IIC [Collinsella]
MRRLTPRRSSVRGHHGYQDNPDFPYCPFGLFRVADGHELPPAPHCARTVGRPCHGRCGAGTIMGATMELAMVGAISVGAYNPPDTISGTILGVSLAMQAGADASAALTLGIPIATIVLALDTALGQPVMLLLVHRIDKNVEDGDTKAITRNMLIAGYAQSWCGLLIIPLAFFFGADAVASLLNIIPDFVQTGMDVAAAFLPALGFAMLAQMIMNKTVAPFFFAGFFLVAYFGISTTGVAIFAAIIVVAMTVLGEKKKAEQPAVATEDPAIGSGFDEF